MTETNHDKTGLRERVCTFFGPETPLARAQEFGGRAYEPRPQQLSMAAAIADAYESGRHLCVEAPTGVGKTYAYLLPSLLLALKVKKPVVVSTHTISLQEQILDKDMPVLAKLLELDCKAAIAKGRANYLCRRRLQAAVSGTRDYLPGPEMLPETERLAIWAETSPDGSRNDLDFEPSASVWEAVCCEYGNCLNARCSFFRECFLMRARRQLADADLIIANHAIFFADLSMKMAADDDDDGGILPGYAAVVLDESQCIEDTAAVHLGVRLTDLGLLRLLRRLYNPARNRGLLAEVMYTEARLTAIAALEAAERFFLQLHRWLEEQPNLPLRYTVPGHVPDMIGDQLVRLEREVQVLIPDEPDEGRSQELKSTLLRIHDFRVALRAFLDMQLAGHVYWLDRTGQNNQILELNAVPVEVGPLLTDNLFHRDFTVIMTSATLAVKGQLDYFLSRIGAGMAETLILDSPFDYASQVTLYVPFNMPNPNDFNNFMPAAIEKIEHFLLHSHGKAFVLFTSYKMMQQMAAEMEGFFAESGLRLFVQGSGLPRSKMLEEFRRDVDSVIFGTSSFWTGVDVPGEALSNVIIVRLPFAVPDHPLAAARQEAVERQGGRAFMDYSLPEAILKFRQGFGRLIRSRDDQGIVVVLDNRITRARYGKAFLDSIPACKQQVY